MKDISLKVGFLPIIHLIPTVYHTQKVMSTQNNKFFIIFLNFFVFERCFVWFLFYFLKIYVIFVVFW